jgi:hypothetical protein
MKKIFSLLMFLLLGIFESSAQYYNVTTKLNQDYKPLANPTTISSSWDQNFFEIQDLGLTYNWYHESFSFDGTNGLVVLGAGVLAAESNADSVAFDIDGFFVGLKSRPNGSAVNYEIDGVQGNRIIKVEWVNAGIDGGDTADFVNLQIWLYEARNTIEVHYGPSLIKNAKDFNAGNNGQGLTGPPVGTFTTSTKRKDNGKVLALSYLTGNPDNPSIIRTRSTGLNGMPKSGTVYTFTDATATSLNEPAAMGSELKIYPNPANDFIRLEYDGNRQPGVISIEDIAGKSLKSVQCEITNSHQSLQISTADMKPGLYLVKLQNGSNTTIQKLMVAR